MSIFITTRRSKGYRNSLSVVVTTGATLNIWRVTPSLGRLRGSEGGGICPSDVDVGNGTIPRGHSITQQRGQLSNPPWGLHVVGNLDAVENSGVSEFQFTTSFHRKTMRNK